MSQHPFLSTPLIILRPYDEEHDLERICGWFNDPRVTQFMFTGQKPATKSHLAALLREDTESPSHAIFIVVDRKSNESIGIAGLYDIHQTARKAEFRIVIGDARFWNKGIGTEAAQAMLYFGFDRLNLHRIFLGFTGGNPAARRTYEKSGFEYEGTLKDDIYRNSRYYDSIRMAVIRDAYYKRYFTVHQKRFGAREPRVNTPAKKNISRHEKKH